MNYWKLFYHIIQFLCELEKEKFRFHHKYDEVYGDLETTDDLLLKKSIPAQFTSILSKAASDHLVRAWAELIIFSLTNCSNNYGPYRIPC